MKTTIHLARAHGRDRATVKDGLLIGETGRPTSVVTVTCDEGPCSVTGGGGSVDVFVDARAALLLARAAVSAYNRLTGATDDAAEGRLYLGEYVVPDVLPPEPEFTEIPDGDLPAWADED
jgi:hypothetical protein